MTSDDDQRSDTSPELEGERLDSWKEIAAFLQRDVRTVQRWEKTAGLPVHRHAAARLRTAYAYRSELEAWWHARRLAGEAAAPVCAEELCQPEASETVPSLPGPELVAVPARWPRRYVAGGAALAGLLAVPLAVLGITRYLPATSVSPSAPVATVVFIPFDNQAGNPRLATALSEALERHLSAHRIELAAPTRLARALRLLRRSAGTPLTEPLGREVAIRDGGIHYLVAGKIQALGSRLYATVRVIDVGGRAHVDVGWEADSPAGLISGASTASATLAERLMASSALPPIEPLEVVTAASVAAARLYTAAVQAGSRRQWGASELLARRAIAADPEFATAHAWIGWAMRQQSRPVRECLPALERAAALATDATDRESYLIGAMLHNVTGNLPAATAALEALLRLYPADFTAMDLLVEVYFRAGRLNKAVDLAVLRAEHTPGDFAANARAAQALTIATQETERPRLFAARALNLATPAAIRDWPGLYAWLHGLPIFQRWLAGETREALEALRALEQTLSTRVSGERDAFAGVIGFAYLAFGMPQDAERIFRHAASPERQLDLAALALSRGDEARARQWLRQVPQLASARPALFARAGLIEEAERGLESAPPSESWEGRALAARGLIDGRRGRRESAMTALRRSLDLLRWSGEPEYFLAIEELVRITRARGDDERALAFLTAATAERAHTYGRTQWTAAQWAALSTTLAALHEQRGQHDAAERVNGSLRQVLQLREPVAASRVR